MDIHLVIAVPAVLSVVCVFLAGTALWKRARWYRQISVELSHAAEKFSILQVDTSMGTVSYAVRDGDYPVLVMHGPGDGSRHGLIRAEKHLERDCMIIVPSRPGYDSTPLPPCMHTDDQADFFASFLDAVQIDRAAVLAYTITFPAAVSLARRYPEKVSSLMLIAPSACLDSHTGLRFLLRARVPLLLGMKKSLMRMAAGDAHAMSYAYRHELEEHLVCCSLNKKGLLHDLRETENETTRTVTSVRAVSHPMLIIYGEGDPLVDVPALQEDSQDNHLIKIVPVQQRGYLLLGAKELIRTETDVFLHLHGGLSALGNTAEPSKRRRGIRTKEMLFGQALILFAEAGFDGSSLRELAARVGIKESSIYNHYSSKEEILEEIFSFYSQRMRENRPSLQEVCEASSYLSADELLTHLILKEAERTDADLEKAIRIIHREKYTNDRARTMYLKVAVEENMRFYSEVFRNLQEHRKIVSGDPLQYARHYRAVLADLAEEQMLKSDGLSQGVTVKRHMIEHARIFARLMKPQGS